MVSVGGVGAGPRASSASDSTFDRGRLGDTMRERLEQMAFAEQAKRTAERSSGERVRTQRSDDDRLASMQVDSRRAERAARRDEAAPAVATAAEDLRSRLKDESVRTADFMTEAATQRALRDYLRAG